MSISVVIPNYNGEKLLAKNLPKVIEAVGESEIIIVDDASTDGSIEKIKYLSQRLIGLRPKKSNIKLVRNRKNLGFSSTVNKGVKEASGNLVVLLNTDVIPEKDFLEPAIRHFENPEVFAVGFLQKCPDDGRIIERGRGIGKFHAGFLVHARGEVDRRDTLWVSGGAGVFRKSIWEELGGLEELYNPFYWEDIDISYRALKAGYKLIFEPESQVIHLQEETIKGQYSKDQVKTIAYSNQLLFVWLNITDWVLLIQHIFYLPYHLIKSIFVQDFPFIKALFRAVLKFPKVLVRRYRNIRSFKMLDQEIVKNING